MPNSSTLSDTVYRWLRVLSDCAGVAPFLPLPYINYDRVAQLCSTPKRPLPLTDPSSPSPPLSLHSAALDIGTQKRREYIASHTQTKNVFPLEGADRAAAGAVVLQDVLRVHLGGVRVLPLLAEPLLRPTRLRLRSGVGPRRDLETETCPIVAFLAERRRRWRRRLRGDRPEQHLAELESVRALFVRLRGGRFQRHFRQVRMHMDESQRPRAQGGGRSVRLVRLECFSVVARHRVVSDLTMATHVVSTANKEQCRHSGHATVCFSTLSALDPPSDLLHLLT